VNNTRRIEAFVASVAPVVVVGPSAVVPGGSGATLRFVLPRMPLSVSWAVVVVSTTTRSTETIGGTACRSDHLKIEFSLNSHLSAC
jgi:hypothetical protein